MRWGEMRRNEWCELWALHVTHRSSRFYSDFTSCTRRSLGPFHGAIAVPSVTRCCCRRRWRRGHRCTGGVRQYSGDTWWIGVRRLVVTNGPNIFQMLVVYITAIISQQTSKFDHVLLPLMDIWNTLLKYWMGYRQLTFITKMSEPLLKSCAVGFAFHLHFSMDNCMFTWKIEL